MRGGEGEESGGDLQCRTLSDVVGRTNGTRQGSAGKSGRVATDRRLGALCALDSQWRVTCGDAG